MNTKPEKMTGGCLCGAVRYEVTAPLQGAQYCHCRMCQKANGAPVVTWTWVPLENFSYSKGEPVALGNETHHARRSPYQREFSPSAWPPGVD